MASSHTKPFALGLLVFDKPQDIRVSEIDHCCTIQQQIQVNFNLPLQMVACTDPITWVHLSITLFYMIHGWKSIFGPAVGRTIQAIILKAASSIQHYRF